MDRHKLKSVRIMTILHLVTKKPDRLAEKIIAEQKKTFEVTVIDLQENKEYDKIVDSIVAADKVISW
jgi:hypothetical protein